MRLLEHPFPCPHPGEGAGGGGGSKFRGKYIEHMNLSEMNSVAINVHTEA